MLDISLVAELKEEEYWSMTIGEVKRYLKAYNKRKNIEEKSRAMNNYILANIISEQVGCMFDSDAKPRSFKEVYPFLFTKEELEEMQKQEEQHLAKVTAIKFREYTEAVNEQRNKNR